ncbi:MAG: WecB/TagA/CpsF family glycosyltransferase [Prevotella sp.]|nr:WecB/TagA/CpsF family glycosyltransferase [Prevotella sp.]
MRMKLKDLDILTSRAELAKLPEGKLLINTINAFSYDNARKDVLFSEALQKGDVLIPDGISIVKACRFLNAKSQPKERIAGWDLFVYEMEKLNRVGGKVMFLGSSDAVLNLIRQRVAEKYPKIEVDTYSPPYKPEFSDEDNEAMISAINHSNPDLLWIGMTAPKQEKWAYTHLDRLDVHCHIGTIGAVFDFFAGTVKRAPERWQRAGLEWLYRLLSEPRRMWRRYFIGNAKFIYYIMLEKIM